MRDLPPNELICRPRAYWLTIRPITGSFAVAAPAESVITAQVFPSSPVTLIPSAVAM